MLVVAFRESGVSFFEGEKTFLLSLRECKDSEKHNPSRDISMFAIRT